MVIDLTGSDDPESTTKVQVIAEAGRVKLVFSNHVVSGIPPEGARELAKALDKVATEASMPVYRGFAWNDLRKAFASVKDKADWKAPISVQVKESRLELVKAAIVYFTSTTAQVMPSTRKGYVLVTADGYRAGPAGP